MFPFLHQPAILGFHFLPHRFDICTPLKVCQSLLTLLSVMSSFSTINY